MKREEEKVQQWHSANFSALENGTAAELGAVWRPDGPEVYDTSSPLSALLAKDTEAEQDRAEIFCDLMAYFFSEGPHPAHVMRRVFDLAFEMEPKLLRDFDGTALYLVRGRDPIAHRRRVGALIERTRCQRRPLEHHEALINATLRVASARRAGEASPFPVVELGNLLDLQEGEELADYEARMAAVRGLLAFLFYAGPVPGDVVRRVFCLAKWRPTTSALLLDMTLHQLGLLFGEVRATWSWRVKHVVNRLLEHRGAKGRRSSFQKSDTACANYAEAQQGNQNRRGGAAQVA